MRRAKIRKQQRQKLAEENKKRKKQAYKERKATRLAKLGAK